MLLNLTSIEPSSCCLIEWKYEEQEITRLSRAQFSRAHCECNILMIYFDGVTVSLACSGMCDLTLFVLLVVTRGV